MGNAPEDIKEKGFALTKDNDHDGIAVFLHSIFPF
jgi:hydroxymethylpyrimidine pyrophosphatase-like HAD family hydrolase